jgi:hypothetical protein
MQPNGLLETEDVDHPAPKTTAKLFRINDDSGSVQFTEVPLPGGKLNQNMLHSGDVFLVHGKANKVPLLC